MLRNSLIEIEGKGERKGGTQNSKFTHNGRKVEKQNQIKANRISSNRKNKMKKEKTRETRKSKASSSGASP